MKLPNDSQAGLSSFQATHLARCNGHGFQCIGTDHVDLVLANGYHGKLLSVAEKFPDRLQKFPVLSQKFPAPMSREFGSNV